MYVKKLLLSLGVATLFCVFGVQAQAENETPQNEEATVYCDTPVWYVDPINNQTFVELNIMIDSSTIFNFARLHISYPKEKLKFIGIDEGDALPLSAGSGFVDEDGKSYLYSLMSIDGGDNWPQGDGLYLATIYFKMIGQIDANTEVVLFEEGTSIVNRGLPLIPTMNNCTAGIDVANPQSKRIDDVLSLFPTTPIPNTDDPALDTLEMGHMYCDTPIETTTKSGEPAVAVKIWADIPESKQIDTASLWIGYDPDAYEYVTIEENSLFSLVGVKATLDDPYAEFGSPNFEPYKGLIRYVVGAPNTSLNRDDWSWGSRMLIGTVYMKPLVNDVTISPLTLIPLLAETQEELDDQDSSFTRGTNTLSRGDRYLVTLGDCNNDVVTLRSGRFRPETMVSVASAEEIPLQIGLQSQDATVAITTTTLVILTTVLGAVTFLARSKRETM